MGLNDTVPVAAAFGAGLLETQSQAEKYRTCSEAELTKDMRAKEIIARMGSFTGVAVAKFGLPYLTPAGAEWFPPASAADNILTATAMSAVAGSHVIHLPSHANYTPYYIPTMLSFKASAANTAVLDLTSYGVNGNQVSETVVLTGTTPVETQFAHIPGTLTINYTGATGTNLTIGAGFYDTGAYWPAFGVPEKFAVPYIDQFENRTPFKGFDPANGYMSRDGIQMLRVTGFAGGPPVVATSTTEYQKGDTGGDPEENVGFWFVKKLTPSATVNAYDNLDKVHAYFYVPPVDGDGASQFIVHYLVNHQFDFKRSDRDAYDVVNGEKNGLRVF